MTIKQVGFVLGGQKQEILEGILEVEEKQEEEEGEDVEDGGGEREGFIEREERGMFD